MIKKHFFYLLFQIKSTFKIIPRLLISLISFTIIISIAGYGGNQLFNTNNSSPINIPIAVVLPQNDAQIDFAYNAISNLDSLESLCNFQSTDESTAKNMLESGSVSAVIIIPNDFIQNIINGSNDPASVIIPNNTGLETLLFCSVLDAGSQSLGYVQSTIYATCDLLRAQGLKEEIPSAEDYLNDFYIKYALNRSNFFDSSTVSSTGDLSTASYYLCSALLLIILFCGLTLSDIFSNHSRNKLEALKTHRMSISFIRFCEFISATLMFILLFGFAILLLVWQNYIPAPSNPILHIFAFIILISSISSFLMLIYCITDEGLVTTLLVFLLSSFMMYACGRIIPPSYLPSAIKTLGGYLPVFWWGDFLETILYGSVDFISFFPSLLWGISFFVISITITSVKRRLIL